ncbi:MAG: S8 family serine peptidase [Chlamydiales bacterium]
MASSSSLGPNMHFIKSREIADVDPNYLFYINSLERNQSSSLSETMIPVIGRIKEIGLTAWKNLGSVVFGSQVFHKKLDCWIVTAYVPHVMFRDVRKQNGVLSLKVAQTVQPMLYQTLQTIRLSQQHFIPPAFPPDILNQGGEGVVVGIVDYGCDFNHERFKIDSTHTRILSIWNQQTGPNPHGPYQVGTVYQRDEINAALAQPNPYQALGYAPGPSAHGTHVMDIATGNSGVAPKAEIIFVHLRTLGSFHKSGGKDLVDAVDYIFQQAHHRPCVVNLSIGTNLGPHDGTNSTEDAFDAHVTGEPNRAIVIAAGNFGESKIHQSGKILQGEQIDLTWDIKDKGNAIHKMQIWYSGEDEFKCAVCAPIGPMSSDISLREKSNIYYSPSLAQVLIGGVTSPEQVFIGEVAHCFHDDNNGDNVFSIEIHPNNIAILGEWKIKLSGEQIKNGNFHAWIERNDFYQSEFRVSDANCTLSSIATGADTIVVGAYNGVNNEIFPPSSAGPTRTGALKPEVSAPGVSVIAASSEGDLVAMSGTSMAAPVITGLIARILGIASSMDKTLNVDQIKTILTPLDGPHNLKLGFSQARANEIIQRALTELA